MPEPQLHMTNVSCRLLLKSQLRLGGQVLSFPGTLNVFKMHGCFSCIVSILCARGYQESAADALELELELVVSYTEPRGLKLEDH